ncbi:MAG: peptide deformylase [Candidatus Marinimicrobia bacterium]|nr:peptide deformylase [Candidatus Neomarinimicrobiota bacterium]|tara:strand:- start:30654 stop:31154 length:501 start_codon:yes stop_codon:yes gene_type:complete
MSVLPLVKYGDPILRKVLDTVKDWKSINNIITDMFDTMYELEGIGLAANQIGLNLNLIVIDISHSDESYPPIAFVNGNILESSGSVSMDEGCLSIPGIQVNITRSERIIFSYQDIKGNSHQKEFSGLMARVIQHEMDHIAGKLIIDYANLVERNRIKTQLKNLGSN